MENDNENVRILVIGAGVNGSVCAAHLHDHGVDVTVLARGERLEHIAREGIVIENPFSHKRTVTRIKTIGELLPDDMYDYILVVVRRNQIPDLLPVLVVNHSPNVVFMTNNLAGPGEIIRALGKQRPMMGFVFAGGKRDRDIIRAIGPPGLSLLASPFGELEGTITPRLKRLVRVFNRAGLKAQISTNIVDWLATHASGVAVIGPMVMKYHNDINALASSADDVRLTVVAMREALAVLKALGHKIVPASQRLLAVVPLFPMEFISRLFLKSGLGEVGGAWHVSQAPDEMRALAEDLRRMVITSGLPVPAIRKVLDMQ
jgi:2-dehydropantoate 2-reductase